MCQHVSARVCERVSVFVCVRERVCEYVFVCTCV